VSIQGGFIVNFTVFAQIIIMYIIRCVYFFLLGYSVVPNTTTSNLPDYILIELPTFFYLGAFSLVALSFLFLYLRGKKDMELSQRDFWISYFVWVLLIWILFAVVVSLIATLLDAPLSVKSCDGRITTLESGSNTARIIRIVYKSTIALIALFVVGGTFMIGHALSDGMCTVLSLWFLTICDHLVCFRCLFRDDLSNTNGHLWSSFELHCVCHLLWD